jgi:hypothetical protein
MDAAHDASEDTRKDKKTTVLSPRAGEREKERKEEGD